MLLSKMLCINARGRIPKFGGKVTERLLLLLSVVFPL
jgi:hypothetical protein